MFSVHTTPEEFKNATITGHFGFVFEENPGKEIIWLGRDNIVSENRAHKMKNLNSSLPLGQVSFKCYLPLMIY